MSLLTDFIIYGGFRPANRMLYSPGKLFSVTSKVAEQIKPKDKRYKVQTLLRKWNIEPDAAPQDQETNIPIYALEFHAINDKDSSLDGYNSYVFIPENNLGPGESSIATTYTKPLDIADDEDPLKVLSALYSDDNGYSTNPNLAVYELTCTKEEFYPLRVWGGNDLSDPADELFDVFDKLKRNEFAGVQLVLRPKPKGYETAGMMRVKSIEDPTYKEEIGLVETISRLWRGRDMPEEEAGRSIKQQRLDTREAETVKLIRHKLLETCCFRATIRVYASSVAVADYLAQIIIQNMSGKHNQLKVVDRYASIRAAALREEGRHRFLMSDEEIATIWHVPDENSYGNRLIKPLPAAMTPPESVMDLTFPLGGDGDIRYLLAQCTQINR